MRLNAITEPYNAIPLIPSFFWRSQIFETLPTPAFHQKTLCKILYDLDHNTFCGKEYFQVEVEGFGCQNLAKNSFAIEKNIQVKEVKLDLKLNYNSVFSAKYLYILVL